MDFVLFDEFEEDKEQVIEYVHLVRERTKTLYSNKLKFVFVELPKFRKTEEELETRFDIWMFILKNLYKLKERPALIQGKIFEKLFELAEIKRLTKKDMETYRKSILDYHDVRLVADCAREEGREEEKIAIVQKCLQKNMAIEDIVFFTDFSKEQIIRYMENSTR